MRHDQRWLREIRKELLVIEDERIGERESERDLDEQSRDENTNGIACGRFEISQTSHTLVGIEL